MLGDTLASGANLAIIAGAFVALVGGILSAVRVGRRWITADVKQDIERIRREVTPNGGNTDSAGDRLVRIEEQLNAHLRESAEDRRLLRATTETLDRHLGWHDGRDHVA